MSIFTWYDAWFLLNYLPVSVPLHHTYYGYLVSSPGPLVPCSFVLVLTCFLCLCLLWLSVCLGTNDAAPVERTLCHLSVTRVTFLETSYIFSASGGYVGAEGPGSYRLTISDLHFNTDPRCDFASGRCSTRRISRSWESWKLPCFGSGGLMSIASAFFLPNYWASAIRSVKLLSWRHRGNSFTVLLALHLVK